MNNTLQIKEKVIPYNIKKNRLARRLRIIIRPDGRITVSTPSYATKKNIEKFVNEKIEWIAKILSGCKPENPQNKLNAEKEYILNKANALRLARKKIAFFAEKYNLKPKKIFIRNQSTRWGSCSAKGNLNFNYRFVFLPENLQDYLIVHELCHLAEMNHSDRFWSLVSQTIPDYKKRRTALRKTGRLIF